MTSNRGFTLVEMMVLVGISAMLLSMVIIYNRQSEDKLILLREQGRMVNFFLRAKSLTISAFTKPLVAGSKVCGYGVHFLIPGAIGYQDQPGYILFQDLIPDPLGKCSSDSDKAYSGSNENVEKVLFDKSIKFGAPQAGQPILVDALFIPPEPQVIFGRGETAAQAIISTQDNSFSRSVTVNNAGQVSTQ